MSSIPYPILALISLTIFAFVHLWGTKIAKPDSTFHGRLLSTGGGVAIAYIFIDLLPKLSKNDVLIKAYLEEFIPYLERHAYIMSLFGFLLFFTVDRYQTLIQRQTIHFWLSLASYAFFNFLVGYAVVDKQNAEVQPLLLFTFAMTLHYFMNDYSLTRVHGQIYKNYGKWILVICLFSGWVVGILVELSKPAIALASAFIGGGVIMNVTRHELSEESPKSLGAFLFASLSYMVLLLAIGHA